MYLANKYIYGPGPAVSLPRPAGMPQPPQKVLRCVLYKDSRRDFDQAAFEGWLTQMKKDHTYLGRDVYPFMRTDKHGHRILTIDYVEIYQFELPARPEISTSTQ